MANHPSQGGRLVGGPTNLRLLSPLAGNGIPAAPALQHGGVDMKHRCRKRRSPKPSNRKCVKMESDIMGLIMRLNNIDARTLVDKGEAVYIPKSEWKAAKQFET